MILRRNVLYVDLAGLVFLLLLAGAVYAFGYVPLRAARAALADDRDAVASAQADASDRAARVRAMAARVAALRECLDASPRAARASEQTLRVSRITELASAHELIVRQFAPGDARPDPRIVRVPFRMSGDCNPDRFRAFLTALRADFPDMEVVSLAIAASPQAPGELARFTLELLWHALPGDAAGDARAGSASQNAPRQDSPRPSP